MSYAASLTWLCVIINVALEQCGTGNVLKSCFPLYVASLALINQKEKCSEL